MTASEILREIARAAWSNGEPGVVFLDTANAANPLPSLGRLLATNPCLTGDTIIATPHGAKSILELLDTKGKIELLVDGKIVCTDERGFFRSGIQMPIYKVETKQGFQVRATADHRFLTKENIWKQVDELLPGDVLKMHDHGDYDGDKSRVEFCLGYLFGNLIGDGTINRSKKHNSAVLMLNKNGGKNVESLKSIIDESFVMVDLKHGKWCDEKNQWVIRSQDLIKKCIEYDICDEISSQKTISDKLEMGSRSLVSGFLSGIFDVDGCIEKKGNRIALTQSDKDGLIRIQRMLLSFGIFSRINLQRESGLAKFPRGMYHCNAVYSLTISSRNILMFRDKIGFNEKRKFNILETKYQDKNFGPCPKNGYAMIETIKHDGYEDVYDCTVPGLHRFDANGFQSHNCGEQ